MASGQNTATKIAAARRAAGSGKYRTRDEVAAATGASPWLQRRHSVPAPSASRAQRRDAAPAPSASLRGAARANVATGWHPPGLARDFKDNYAGLLPGDVSVAQLDELADTDDDDTLAAVALHPRTGTSVLHYIACRDALTDVKWALVCNPRLPPDALLEVQNRLDGPPYTPHDQNLYAACASHPNYPAPVRVIGR